MIDIFDKIGSFFDMPGSAVAFFAAIIIPCVVLGLIFAFFKRNKPV